MTALAALFTRLAVPGWLRLPLAYLTSAIALIGLLALLKGCYDDAVIERHDTAVQAQVQATASAAADDAHRAAAKKTTEVEQKNAQARDAAARSSDPLGDGLRSLRAETGPNRAPAR